MKTSELIRRALLRGGRRPSVVGQSGTSRRRGEGYEFAELRSYVSGDDPRRIDWAATARAGSMQTRVVLEEHALILAAIVDDSGSMDLGRARSRLDQAREAMRVWYGVAGSGDRCVRIGSDEIVAPRETGGFAAVRLCGEHDVPTGDVAKALRNAYATLPAGSSILCITDMQTRLDEEMLFLIGCRHDATLLLARDPWHDDLPLRGFVRLRDAESGRMRRYFVTSRGVARYREAIRAREAELALQFQTAGWRFALLDSAPEEDLRAAFVHA